MAFTSTKLVALLSALPFFVSSARAAGAIACLTQSLDGGVGEIPAHNAEFSVGIDTFISSAFADSCSEMIGAIADPTSTWSDGNGNSIQASFWITTDLCMNVQVEDDHWFCCPSTINQGDGALTECSL